MRENPFSDIRLLLDQNFYLIDINIIIVMTVITHKSDLHVHWECIVLRYKGRFDYSGDKASLLI
jgi:hypothetical protein